MKDIQILIHNNMKNYYYHLQRTSKYYICHNFIQKRHISKKKLLQKTEGNIIKATEYFNKVYPGVYGEAWVGIKRSLFQKNKYIAIINNFTNYEPFVDKIEEDGAFEIGHFYNKSIKKHWNNQEKLIAASIGFENNEHFSKENLVKFSSESSHAEGLHQPEWEIHTHMSDEPDENRKLDEASIGSTANYVQSKKFKGLEDWMEEKDVFADINETDKEIGIKKHVLENPLKWPGILKAYVFVLGDNSEFPETYKWKQHGFHSHYLLNGSSILPVLALDLKPEDKVLDMCAAPGGKSLIMLQSGLINYLECNDESRTRSFRIDDIMNEYIPKESSTRNSFQVSQSDGRDVHSPGYFDKVLVDAPCLNDRISLSENDNNIFKTTRLKERIHMPEFQAELISSALRFVKVGGSVVYSTCTLSPFQNDGAVYLALSRSWNEYDIECTVVDLSHTLKHLRTIFKFGYKLGLRYGHVVLPAINRNFGPMYFCKIIRNK